MVNIYKFSNRHSKYKLQHIEALMYIELYDVPTISEQSIHKFNKTTKNYQGLSRDNDNYLLLTHAKV